MNRQESKIIDGKRIANLLLDNLKTQIANTARVNKIIPKLVILLVGDDIASITYINNKIKAGLKVGIETKLKKYQNTVAEQTLINDIEILNNDPSVSGIIVQFPLPGYIDKFNVVNAISPVKDVDGFHPINLGLLYSPYKHKIVPCTAAGCLYLIKYFIKNLSGKNVVIIGRSAIVGRPLAALLLKEDCTVTICHSQTKQLDLITYSADIVISAIGKPGFLTEKYFNSNAMVIDVGINKVPSLEKSALVGDVDWHSVKKNIKYITPVPGGVGPMTVAYLMLNTYNAALNQNQIVKRER